MLLLETSTMSAAMDESNLETEFDRLFAQADLGAHSPRARRLTKPVAADQDGEINGHDANQFFRRYNLANGVLKKATAHGG